MAWIEQQELRRSGSKTWRDDVTGLFHTHASIARLHYETTPDSGIYDGEIAALPTRINNAQLDGWLVTQNGWHYALGIPGSGVLAGLDGVVGFGGRRGQNWLRSRLTRVGYLHWPTRDWQDIGGLPAYVRTGGRLTQVSQTKTIGPSGTQIVYPLSALATWNRIWALGGGTTRPIDIRWRIAGRDMKEEIVVSQAAREWIVANAPPSTPANETYFGFVFRLDASDIPRWVKGAVQQDITGDFDDSDGTSIRIEDSLNRLLGFLPISQAYSQAYTVGLHTNVRDWRTLRKRIWRDPDGNTYLLIGALVPDLNSMVAGPVVFDPTFTVAETNEDGASGSTNEDNDEMVLPSQAVFGTFYIGCDLATPINNMDGGWIWRSTAIPQGATINTATVTLVQQSTDFDAGHTLAWDFFNVDTPTDFLNADVHRISVHHARTGSPVSDNSWADAATHTSPSLVTPMQIVVNRAGFSGDIGATCINGSAAVSAWWNWADYTDNAANAADLIATWTVAGTSTFPPVPASRILKTSYSTIARM